MGQRLVCSASSPCYLHQGCTSVSRVCPISAIALCVCSATSNEAKSRLLMMPVTCASCRSTATPAAVCIPWHAAWPCQPCNVRRGLRVAATANALFLTPLPHQVSSCMALLLLRSTVWLCIGCAVDGCFAIGLFWHAADIWTLERERRLLRLPLLLTQRLGGALLRLGLLRICLGLLSRRRWAVICKPCSSTVDDR